MSGVVHENAPRLGPQKIQLVLQAVDLAFQLIEGHAVPAEVDYRSLILRGVRDHDRDTCGCGRSGRVDLKSERADLAHDPHSE